MHRYCNDVRGDIHNLSFPLSHGQGHPSGILYEPPDYCYNRSLYIPPAESFHLYHHTTDADNETCATIRTKGKKKKKGGKGRKKEKRWKRNSGGCKGDDL